MKHLQTILKEAKHPGVGTLSDQNVETCFAAWVGLGDASAITVEECRPLPDSVFAASVDWLVEAWTSHGSSSMTSRSVDVSSDTSLVNDTPSSGSLERTFVARANNPLLLTAMNESTTGSTTTLEAVYDSIRATKWLRAWMEFNLDPDPSSEASSAHNGTQLSRRLLRMDSCVATSANDAATTGSDSMLETVTATAPIYTQTSPRHALIRALYHHVQDLPVIQQQMLAYSQRLQNRAPSESKDPHSMIGLSDPSARLQQYEQALAHAAALQHEWQAHLDRLQFVLEDVYAASDTDQRKLCRRLLGHVWSLYTLQTCTNGSTVRYENTSAAAIRLTLHVLHRILLGRKEGTVVSDVATHLLFHQLMPLHQADGVVLWRDQIAVLELYHEPLCQCMALLLHQDRAQLVPAVIQQLAHTRIFPLSGSAGKQVLLLHEMDTYLHLLPDPIESTGNTQGERERHMLRALLPTLARCMSSEHSRVAEQALQYFQNKSFERLISSNFELSLKLLLPALVRREPSWNPTVRKMTYHVLVQLQGYHEAVFASVANRLFAHVDAVMEPSHTETTPTSIVATQLQESESNRAMTTTVKDFSLTAGMGSWKPSLPNSRSGALMGSMPPPMSRPNPRLGGVPGKGMAPWANMPSLKSNSVVPPATVTGVAPWAMQASTPSSGITPPLTVTGVAPWAMQPPTPSHSITPPLTVTGVAPWAVNASTLGQKRVAPEPTVSATMETAESDTPRTGLEYVLATMATLKPPHEEEGLSSWSVAQMAETPTLLPHLKFHDLVFGHDLGSGAFGSVRYARLIDKAKPRSQWPEYAVKVVSTEKIRELGYEASIQREIAVLRLLSHPGIARLVSSFRFQSGAYLVLEYASRGDLHTLLQKHGSLDMESTRFVIGEVVAALASIHESGFGYFDLKPENIVISESGHIKITDFGGCRPVTEAAKALVKSVSRDILQNMRDGDWKENPTTPPRQGDSPSDSWDETSESKIVEDDEDDERIEGTTSYLPPEVVMGAFPTIAADAWALGCVTYQCLSGRPPLLEADEAATKNRIVRFDFGVNPNSNEMDRLFDNKHASAITAAARDMITLLLNRDPNARPGMNELAEHDFFTANVFALYSQPAFPLDVGTVAPSPNAQWSRRQFSSIWAPQPAAYKITLPADAGTEHETWVKFADAPIQEGDEASGYFSPSGKAISDKPLIGR